MYIDMWVTGVTDFKYEVINVICDLAENCKCTVAWKYCQIVYSFYLNIMRNCCDLLLLAQKSIEPLPSCYIVCVEQKL